MKKLLFGTTRLVALVSLLAFWLALPLLAQPQTAAQSSAVDAIINEGKTNNRVMEHLDYLCNHIGPRMSGSDKLTQACEWAADQFKKFGCTKAYLEECGAIPVGFNRGPQYGSAIVDGRATQLTCMTLAWTAGTNGTLTGPAVLAPATPNEANTAKLRGAWAVMQSLPANQTDADRLIKAIQAVGALGIVRSSRKDPMLMGGKYQISWENRPRWPIVIVMRSHFEPFYEALKAGRDVQLTFNIVNEFKKGPIPLYNVIAEITGTVKPDECVIVGGHIDSWDLGTGAVDNGCGVATTMEAARILCAVGAKPKRTIRFMLWPGEEQGFIGSAGWVRRHPAELHKVSAVFVQDMGTNYISGVKATPSIYPFFKSIFAPVMNLDPQMKFVVREAATLPRTPSDNLPFLRAGIPSFLWAQTGRANYEGVMHTQFDTFDKVIPEYQKHSAIIVAVAAWGVANLDSLLPR